MAGMEITEVRVFPVHEEKLKAFVSIVFDHCFMVNDLKVIQGKDSLFLSMPSRRKKNGEYKDVAHPLNNETRRRLEERVLGEYARVLSGEVTAPEPTSPGAPPPAVENDRSLAEIEELHLRDSFWTVS
jgi:stage V sporulation protein G